MGWDSHWKWLAYIVIGLSIPGLFEFSKKSRLDRTIGELSYPVYMIHMLLLSFLAASGRQLGVPVIGEILLALTIPVAYLLYRFVEKPVDAWRQRLAVAS